MYGSAQSFGRFRGMGAADHIDGRGGLDEVDFRFDPNGVTVDLLAGGAIDGWGNTDTLFDIERARGSQHADTLLGDGGVNRLRGRDGEAGADTNGR
jgi:serralysin